MTILSLVKKVTKPLLIIGGINWGLIGLANFDIVNTVFGGIPIVKQVVLIGVGIGAIIVAKEWYGKK